MRTTLAGVFALMTGTLGIAGAQVPRLEPMAIPQLGELGPERLAAAVAVSPTGTLAFSQGFDEAGRLMTVIASDGRVIGRFGRPGAGPGELRPPLQVLFVNDEVVVLELAARRLSRFSQAGELRGVSTSPNAFFLIAAAPGDSVDVLEWPADRGPRILGFRRVATRTLEGRTLLSGAHASIAELAADGQRGGTAVANVTYAATTEGIFAVNIATYSGVVVDRDGRTISKVSGPSLRTPTGTAALLSAGTLQVDSHGRVWVFAEVPNGAMVADLFRGSRHVGRLALPCRGAPTLTGAHLALLCATGADGSRDVELRVFRIAEGSA